MKEGIKELKVSRVVGKEKMGMNNAAEYIEQGLINQLARYMLENLEELPISLKKEYSDMAGEYIFTLRLNIVSGSISRELRQISEIHYPRFNTPIRTVPEEQSSREGICLDTGSDKWLHDDLNR